MAVMTEDIFFLDSLTSLGFLAIAAKAAVAKSIAQGTPGKLEETTTSITIRLEKLSYNTTFPKKYK
jgi:hypothetical protein